MNDIFKNDLTQIDKRDMYFLRQRFKVRLFNKIAAHYVQFAEKNGLTQKQFAYIARKDPTRLNKLLSGPGNITLDTISDLLFAMGFELSDEFVPLQEHNEEAVPVVKLDPSKSRTIEVSKINENQKSGTKNSYSVNVFH